jgi:DNA-binding Lrp family transcriptional regulator
VLKKGEIMISAYILLNIQPGKTETVIKEIRQLEDIAKISIVTGEYDVVVRTQIKSLDGLLKVTDKIQMIKGVNKTTTQVIEKEITL